MIKDKLGSIKKAPKNGNAATSIEFPDKSLDKKASESSLPDDLQEALKARFPDAKIEVTRQVHSQPTGPLDCFPTVDAYHVLVDGEKYTIGANSLNRGEISEGHTGTLIGGGKPSSEPPFKFPFPKAPSETGPKGTEPSSPETPRTSSDKVLDILNYSGREFSPELKESFKQLGPTLTRTLLDNFSSIESLDIGKSSHERPVSLQQVTVNGEPQTLWAVTGGFLPHSGNYNVLPGHHDDPLSHVMRINQDS